MITDLRRWARSFRSVQSNDVAKLLETAASKIEKRERDPALAAELIVCAMTREHLPEQQSVARLMHEASAVLTPV